MPDAGLRISKTADLLSITSLEFTENGLEKKEIATEQQFSG